MLGSRHNFVCTHWDQNRTCVCDEPQRVYARSVRTRTNMNLDRQLVAEAAAVLGTRGSTQTVHAAMAEVVRAARRRRLAAHEFSDLTPERLDTLRRPRAGP